MAASTCLDVWWSVLQVKGKRHGRYDIAVRSILGGCSALYDNGSTQPPRQALCKDIHLQSPQFNHCRSPAIGDLQCSSPASKTNPATQQHS